jgi:hypothetical protein
VRYLVTLFVLVGANVALAQNATPAPGVSVSYEATRDRFHYRFENPSSFDTAELVPHEFQQTYWGDNHWLTVRATYRAGTRALTTEFAATPQRTTRGDDFDTFFQPSGDIAVSGTTGNVSMRSLRIRQTVALGRGFGIDWMAGYQYRRDRSVFHDATKIVTHTQPPSRVETLETTRETTISNVHEVQFVAARAWNTQRRWRGNVEVALSPTTNARLTTILPDKYPGREILFTAIVFTLAPRVTIAYGERWPIELSVGGIRTFSYQNSRQFERTAASVSVGIGWTRLPPRSP